MDRNKYTLSIIAVSVLMFLGFLYYAYSWGDMDGFSVIFEEKVAVTSVVCNSSTLVTAYANSAQDNTVTITHAFFKTENRTKIQIPNIPDVVITREDLLTPVPCNITSGIITVGHKYTLTLVSKAGTHFLSPSFTA